MYTVNYGGNVSKPQLEWLDRELTRGKNAGEDTIVLMHHDPRGGHRRHRLWLLLADARVPRHRPEHAQLHLQRASSSPPSASSPTGRSPSTIARAASTTASRSGWARMRSSTRTAPVFFLSGIELLKRFVKSDHARTLLLGHVHFNSLEVLQSGDVLVPNRLSLDPAVQTKSASLEAANPVRRVSWEDRLMPSTPGALALRRGCAECLRDARARDEPRRTLVRSLAQRPRRNARRRDAEGDDDALRADGWAARARDLALHLGRRPREPDVRGRIDVRLLDPPRDEADGRAARQPARPTSSTPAPTPSTRSRRSTSTALAASLRGTRRTLPPSSSTGRSSPRLRDRFAAAEAEVIVHVHRCLERLHVPARVEVAVIGVSAGLVRRRRGDGLVRLLRELVVEPRAAFELRDRPSRPRGAS